MDKKKEIIKEAVRRKSKELSELNMLDAFLFKAATEKLEYAEFIAKLIIERATGRKIDKIVVESEKQLSGIDMDRRGVRIDLCISELEYGKIARVYDIEPNNYDISQLPKRDRFYQSILDVKLLGSGQRFNELPDFVSIWILPEDPFGCDRMIYTVKNVVEGNNELLYNDGVMKIFLYTHGKYGGSEELRALLKYMSSASAVDAVDYELEELHKMIDAVKHSREVGERYMTLQDLIDVEKFKSYDEGVASMEEKVKEALAEKDAALKAVAEATKAAELKASITTYVKTCRSFGQDDEATKAGLMREYSLSDKEAEQYIS